MKEIVCIKDSTENRQRFFQICNEQWPFERMKTEFMTRNPQSMGYTEFHWKGHFESFINFMKQHNALEVELPTVDAPAYPDPDYDE